MLGQKIADYAYRFWMRHNMEQWPPVRQVARALGIRQQTVEDEAGEFYQTTQYNVLPREPLGDHSVEAMTPAVDEAWRIYWGAPR